jgi:hypothetical protein
MDLPGDFCQVAGERQVGWGIETRLPPMMNTVSNCPELIPWVNSVIAANIPPRCSSGSSV